VGQRPKGLVITLAINWLIKPFTMAALAVLFFNHVFAGLIDPERAPEYIAGLILLGAAPCTAMVFVWSQLTKGDPNYTLVQVSVNDLIMVVAFAPNRCAASQMTQTTPIRMASAFSIAAMIVARPRPQVWARDAARLARTAAPQANSKPATSVRLCATSASNASEPVRNPAVASTMT